MDINSLIPSEYDRRARLGPTLLVILPPALAGACWFQLFTWPQLASGVCLAAFLGLLAQLGRDRGKLLEPQLFKEWGGKPSVQLLRHRSEYLPAETRERYHRKLRELMPGTHIAGQLDEMADPDAADIAYDSCSDFLRGKTRDTQVFRLLFEENMNYGMRRNLLAMKPAGIFLSIAGFVSAGLAAVVKSDGGQVPPFPVIAMVVNGLMVSLWVMRFTRNWVRVPAFAYGEQLLAACETLQSPASKPTGYHTVQRS